MLNKRTIHIFYDLLSTHSTLREIEDLFECEEILSDPFYKSNLVGARRSFADTYIKSLDLINTSDIRKVLNVIEIFFLNNEHNNVFQEDPRVQQLLKLLERDGFVFVNEKFKSISPTYIPKEIEGITIEYDIEHVNKDWVRSLDQVKTDPEGAITATRSMLESTLKWILDDTNVEYERKENLNQLYRRVAEQLNLAPDKHGDEIFKQILGSINGVISGLGSLRNEYGNSHGKSKVYYKPSERHAKFAINLSGTVCIYLFETYFTNVKESNKVSK